MGLTFQVKARLILLGGFLLDAGALAQSSPDAQEILRSVRLAQASQHRVMRGRLRNEGKTIPFRLLVDGNLIRYEFSDPPQIIQLRLFERDSRLEEITRSGTERVSPARFDEKVRDSDIAYEDLALKFLYWPNARVEGEQTMLLRKCWKLRTEPATRDESLYARVVLWIEKESGALMQAEAFDATGKLAKRCKVISGQKVGGAWILKQMRIEVPVAGRSADRSPTYLEIEGVENR
jgi:Outer membrane lipoprotein-sorting protein